MKSTNYPSDLTDAQFARLEWLRAWWNNGSYNANRFTSPGMLAGAAEAINSAKKLNDQFPTAVGFIPNAATQLMFSSYHSGGAQVCLGDGSVRFLNESINLTTLKNLGAMNDGQVLGDF